MHHFQRINKYSFSYCWVLNLEKQINMNSPDSETGTIAGLQPVSRRAVGATQSDALG